MDFLDEEVIKFRKQVKKSKYSTLETGFYIKDELVHFEECQILGDKVSVMLPDTFVDMPVNLAKLKYLSEQRPQIIKTSLDTTVNFTFSLYEIVLSGKTIGSTIHQFKNLIQRVNPAYVFDEIVIEEEQGVGWFDFKSYGIDEQIYNIMYVKPIGGRMLHGVFNCMYRDVVEWKDAALQVICSIRDCTKEEGVKWLTGRI